MAGEQHSIKMDRGRHMSYYNNLCQGTGISACADLECAHQLGTQSSVPRTRLFLSKKGPTGYDESVTLGEPSGIQRVFYRKGLLRDGNST